MGARALLRMLIVLSVAVTSLGAWSTTASAGECPNEARREEQNATYLPDCRAYEMVSPVDKKGSDIIGFNNTAHISDTGERATFMASAGFGEANGTGFAGWSQYVATRSATEGWGHAFGITPVPAKDDPQIAIGVTAITKFSGTFERVLFQSYQMAESVNPDLPHNVNLYTEDTADGSLEALTSPRGVDPSSIGLFAFEGPVFGGASSDFGVVTFQGYADLIPGLPSGSKLYKWDHGTLEDAGVLPDGSYPAGGSATPTTFYNYGGEEGARSVSGDGSRVLFRSPVDGSKPPQLYLRKGTASTAWVSQSEASAPNPEPEGVEYVDMTRDGKKVVFFSQTPLTDSDPGGEGYGLYIYTDGPEPEKETNLTFIARVSTGTLWAPYETFAAMGEDANRLYFFSYANASLPQTGTYLWDEGTVRFVAPTPTNIGGDGGSRNQPNFFTGSISEASADGKQLAFITPHQLTSAPVGEVGGTTLPAMYLYDEETNTLKCVSCLPSGAPTASAASMLPDLTKSVLNFYLQSRGRFLTPNGKYVFFSTADALVPSDVNGLEDVYEYNVQTGAVSLVSSGTGDSSWFSDASPDGSDVLFVTRQSYLRQDDDKLVDVYDARIGGGFPEPAPSTGGCVGDECQGVPSAAPTFNTASGFTGLGNVMHGQTSKPTSRGKPSRARKLALALKACKRRKGRARHRCVARVRRRYGAHKASNGTSRAARR